ncbi:MAG: CcmD family protein [Terriglobales bacterium]
MKFLYAAYAVTWIVHLAYLGWMMRGYRRAKQELEELEK